MRASFVVVTLGSMLVTAAFARTANAQCAVGDEFRSQRTLTEASIPGLSALQGAQIVLAVQESAHTDVTTVEEAFDRVDDHEINEIVLRDSSNNRFYTEMEFGAGGNSYGAIFYWGTTQKAAAIHDGFLEECAPFQSPADFAPECEGFLDYANTATFAQLDAYLPSNVAQAIVDARTADPFDSIQSVVAVSGVAEVRLQQILAAARAASFVDASCDGIHDYIAISADEATVLIDFVNGASSEELHGALHILINETVVAEIIAARPYTTAAELAATYR